MLGAEVLKIDNKKTELLAENLSALIKQKNLNASKVAQDLQLPVMTIRRLMLGQTTDPRLSTLKMLADYFNVSIDALTGEVSYQELGSWKNTRPNFVPILPWETIEKIDSIKELDLSAWKEWQPISVSGKDGIGKNAFALESRPSMHPRFPQNTIFVIDPDYMPKDGDIVLVKIKKGNELTLRELIIDPPQWRLQSVISDANVIVYSEIDLQIVGVNVLTILYNRKNQN
jgi:transcriptional regulator with XRE-family HTH domain